MELKNSKLDQSKEWSNDSDSYPNEDDAGQVHPETEFHHLRQGNHPRSIDDCIGGSGHGEHEGEAAADGTTQNRRKGIDRG